MRMHNTSEKVKVYSKVLDYFSWTKKKLAYILLVIFSKHAQLPIHKNEALK